MKIILTFLLLTSFSLFGQETKYNLMIIDPCSKKVEYGILYHLEKLGKVFSINDSIGTIYLKEPGKYELITEYGISKNVEIKKGINIDTLFTKRINECLEPVSHPNFIGYCCCEEKCNGIQKDYYNDGTLRIEGKFKNGIPTDKVIKYHPNGNIKEIRIYNRNGILRRTKYYDLSGKKIKKYSVQQRTELKSNSFLH